MLGLTGKSEEDKMGALSIPEDPSPRTGPRTGVLGNGKWSQCLIQIVVTYSVEWVIACH